MDEWDKEFSKFLKKQDKEFLQKVQGLKVYLFDAVIHKKPKIIARFFANGKTLYIPNFGELPFCQSFTPNHGIYQTELISYTHYVGILFTDDEVFMYSTHYFDNLFKVNGKHILLTKYPITPIY